MVGRRGGGEERERGNIPTPNSTITVCSFSRDTTEQAT